MFSKSTPILGILAEIFMDEMTYLEFVFSTSLCLIAQSCLLFSTLWNVAHHALLSMEFFQARILEWAATASSRGSFQPKDRTHVSRVSCIGGRFLTR